MLLRSSQHSIIRPDRTERSAVVRSSATRDLLTASSPLFKATSQRRSLKVGAAAVQESAQGSTQEKYDVYVHEPIPLKAGESKHVISVLVADESGLINRVAGVFARRGANIESLAVGLTEDKALFTIVVTGTESTVGTLVKQLAKLVNVKYVEDITKAHRVERELMLMKVQVQAGAQRTEVLQLAQIFRAAISDVAENTLALSVAGDPGKLAAIQKVMAKFGIQEMARTGRVCLQRGEQVNWQHSLSRARRLPAQEHSASPAPVEDEDDAEAEGQDGADVYQVDPSDLKGVWQVQNILEPTFSSSVGDYDVHTLSIEVEDMPGVLNQVTGCFARRGYNIQSLAVGPSERPNMSRITMVVPGNEESISKLFKQLGKVVYVDQMMDLTNTPFLQRELMLIKVRCTAAQRGQLRHLAQIFRANILDVGPTTVIFEIIGKADKLKALTDLLEPYGVLEVARTGRIALPRDSGVDSYYLEKVAYQKVY